MIIFNTTYHIDESLHNQFVEWLISDFIPAATENGVLTNPRLCKILSDEDQSGVSYSLQFSVDDVDVLNDWYEMTGADLNSTLVEKYGNSVAGFSTLLQVII